MRTFAAAFCLAVCGCSPAGSAGALYGEIAAHPFWKVRVTPAQVEALVEKIRAEKGTSVVFIDDSFRHGVARDTDGPETRAYIDAVGPDQFKPAAVGRRYVTIDLYTSFPSRPTPEAVARQLLAALGVRDYKH